MSILTTLLCIVVGVFIATCIISNVYEKDKFDNAMHELYVEQMKMRS